MHTNIHHLLETVTAYDVIVINGIVKAGELSVAMHVYNPLCDVRIGSYVMVCVMSVFPLKSAPTEMPSVFDTGFPLGPSHWISGVLERPLKLSTAVQLIAKLDPTAAGPVLRGMIWTVMGALTGTVHGRR